MRTGAPIYLLSGGVDRQSAVSGTVELLVPHQRALFSSCCSWRSSFICFVPGIAPVPQACGAWVTFIRFHARCLAALNFLLLPVDGAPCIFASFLFVAWLHLVLLLADVGIRDQRSPSPNTGGACVGLLLLTASCVHHIQISWNSARWGHQDSIRLSPTLQTEALTIRLARAPS